MESNLPQEHVHESLLYLWRRVVYLLSLARTKEFGRFPEDCLPSLRGQIMLYNQSGIWAIKSVPNYATITNINYLFKEVGHLHVIAVPDNSIFKKTLFFLAAMGVDSYEGVETFLSRSMDDLWSFDQRITPRQLEYLAADIGISEALLVNNIASRDLPISRRNRILDKLELHDISIEEFKYFVGSCAAVLEGDLPNNPGQKLTDCDQKIEELLIEKYPRLKEIIEEATDRRRKYSLRKSGHRRKVPIIEEKGVLLVAPRKIISRGSIRKNDIIVKKTIEESVISMNKFNDLKEVKEFYSNFTEKSGKEQFVSEIRELRENELWTAKAFREWSNGLDLSQAFYDLGVRKTSGYIYRLAKSCIQGLSFEESMEEENQLRVDTKDIILRESELRGTNLTARKVNFLSKKFDPGKRLHNFDRKVINLLAEIETAQNAIEDVHRDDSVDAPLPLFNNERSQAVGEVASAIVSLASKLEAESMVPREQGLEGSLVPSNEGIPDANSASGRLFEFLKNKDIEDIAEILIGLNNEVLEKTWNLLNTELSSDKIHDLYNILSKGFVARLMNCVISNE